ncbi:MAG: amidohydrolase family protein [Candidatus Magasanikbacteria bacterium]|jgi:cytosine/creatinine deaminase|nr:amidohydrolase family protein [Candidatus Magasanikbacteria bacterium]MBT4315171.1 amidohydrolase family protein [Candidatus Magasanikbacteria bacterium]MBT4547373.1 amidohydrolase family protein [Candidatus Magasanikbacteria bacterium]MBT6819026.1 amidohydrolase family protein [Candidatus Magasanikbacteria bacterium]
MQDWNLKNKFLTAVNTNGGFVNCHGHFDKAFFISPEKLDNSMLDMQAKWQLSDDTKRNSSIDEIADRIRCALDIMIDQGVKTTLSFIDAYSAVGQKAVIAANQVKQEYKYKINFLIAPQPIGGLLDPEERKIFELAASKSDIVGGLPSRDRPYIQKSFDILFSIAKKLDKPIHVHIDQENNPDERDTETLIYYTKKYGYEGRVVAIHAVSTTTQPKKYRKHLYKKMAELKISVVVCPSAALSMKPTNNKLSPIRNSIAPISEMIEAGITVGLGVDNIYDFYQPFVDGDLWFETRMLMEATRFYDFEKVLKIVTENGKKILNIK